MKSQQLDIYPMPEVQSTGFVREGGNWHAALISFTVKLSAQMGAFLSLG